MPRSRDVGLPLEITESEVNDIVFFHRKQRKRTVMNNTDIVHLL